MDAVEPLHPGKPGVVDKTPETMGKMLEPVEDVDQMSLERLDGRVSAVGEGAFGLRPDALIGVEFGSVGGKTIEVKSARAGQRLPDQQAAMGARVVSQQDDGAAKMRVAGRDFGKWWLGSQTFRKRWARGAIAMTYAEYYEGAAHCAEPRGYRLEEFARCDGEVVPARMVQILEHKESMVCCFAVSSDSGNSQRSISPTSLRSRLVIPRWL
jgi:hypothetical protein